VFGAGPTSACPATRHRERRASEKRFPEVYSVTTGLVELHASNLHERSGFRMPSGAISCWGWVPNVFVVCSRSDGLPHPTANSRKRSRRGNLLTVMRLRRGSRQATAAHQHVIGASLECVVDLDGVTNDIAST